MNVWLLDANVLIALTTREHVHHRRAARWFEAKVQRFATCPLTQSALLRFQLRFGKDTTPASAWSVLQALLALPEHEFWPDELDFLAVDPRRLTGHRQVNDAYLAALALRRKGRLATLDTGLAQVHPEAATLVPV